MNDNVFDDDIPLPRPARNKRAIWHEMKVGQSKLGDRALGEAARQFGIKHGIKFTVRRLPDGGYRIWRIA